MSQPFDLSQFLDLPPEVMNAFEAVQFELLVERAARQHEQAVGAEKDAFITELKALVEKLEARSDNTDMRSSDPNQKSSIPRNWSWRWKISRPPSPKRRRRSLRVGDKIAASATDPDKAVPRAPRKARTLPNPHNELNRESPVSSL